MSKVNASTYRGHLIEQNALIKQKVLMSCFEDSLSAKIAKSSMVSESDFACNSKVIIPVLVDDESCDIDEFFSQGNGHIEELNPLVRHPSFTMCRSFRFSHKIDRLDWERLCNGQKMLEEDVLTNYFKRKIAGRQDRYSLNRLMASVTKKTSGNKAGLFENIKLGETSQADSTVTARVVTTAQEFYQVLKDMNIVAGQFNLSGCSTLTNVMDSEAYSWLLETQIGTNLCCVDNPLYTGRVRNSLGYDVMTGNRLPVFKDDAGNIVHRIFLLDETTFAAPFSVNYADDNSSSAQGEHHIKYAMAGAYDAFVVQPERVIMANVIFKGA